ncbi:helix-turn-helix domain-containing protein [Streptomyces sp. NPDC001984]
MKHDTDTGRPKRGRAATRPVAERHAAREASRARLGLTANNRGQTKLPADLVRAVRDGKATASHATIWAVVDLACALREGRCTAAQGTLADAIGTSTPRLARLVADNSPLLRGVDGRAPFMAQERQERGIQTHYFALRKVRGAGQMGGWAPTWTLTLVCDGTAHEQLVPARLLSPTAWLSYAVLVWRAGDEGACRRTLGELAAELGVSEREAKRVTRELRAAGLLLVRDHRGDARKPGTAASKPNTYIPVVVRKPRPQGQEWAVVALLRQLPAELPQSQAWTLDRLDPSAGLTASQPGRVGFGGWAAWRALAVVGAVPCFPETLADTYGVPEETATQWAEEAALAGLMVLETDPITWRAVLDQPAATERTEPGEKGESMRPGLLDPMGPGLLEGMGSDLLDPIGPGLSDETQTLFMDPSQLGGLMSVPRAEVVGGESDVVAAPPTAHAVDARGPRPTAGTGKTKPHREDIARVLGAPEVRTLLLDRMTDWQRRAAEREVAEALAAGTSADQLAYRVTVALVGKSANEIRSPYGWLGRVVTARFGCTSTCTCSDPECEAGVIWYDGTACHHCEREREDRIAAAAKQAAPVETANHYSVPFQRAEQTPDGPPRGECRSCDVRIFLTGPALHDTLCRLCREEARQDDEAQAPTLTVVQGTGQAPATMDRPLLATMGGGTDAAADALPPAKTQAHAAVRARKGVRYAS